MNRRRLFAALGAVGFAPLFAGWVRPDRSPLDDTRDFLRPGLNAIMQESPISVQADIIVCYATRSLIVVAWRDGVEPMAFMVTPQVIEGRLFGMFAPSATKLRDVIVAGSA